MVIFKVSISNSLLLLGTLIFLFTGFSVQAEQGVDSLAELQKNSRHEILLTHGVDTTPEALKGFLENGFSERILRIGLPESPPVKSEVYMQAIQEIGFQQEESAVSQLITIMEGELNPAIRSIIRRDTETYPVDTADLVFERYHNLIRFNAMVALGLIGERQAIPAIRHFISTQESKSYLLEGVIALSLLGEKNSIQLLSNGITDPEDRYVEEMFQAVFIISGRNYDITEVSSIPKKQESMEKLKDWLAQTEPVEPFRADLLRRRQQRVEIEDIPVSTTRGALRATKNFSDYDKRYAGRSFLRSNAPALWQEIRLIANDEFEDVDIRMAALEWYAASKPDEAKKDLKKIKSNDIDSRIVEKAESLLEDIDELKRAKS